MLDPIILPPYVIADLYRRRWRIEQAFNTVKRLLDLSYLLDLSGILTWGQKNGRTEFSPSTKMKNPLDYIQEYPHRTKQILGISNEQFQELLNQAEIHHNKIQVEIECKKIRINEKGGGRKPKMEVKEEICLCLFYLRQMPTFEVLGLHFGVSKTEANDTFHYWLKILPNILPASLIEEVEKHDSDYAYGTRRRRSL